jgi:hypothetical protein
MKTKQASDNRHDVLSLAGRIVNFYRFFNRQDWTRCYEYIDPNIRGKGNVGLEGYSQSMRAFFEAFGPVQQVKILKLSVYRGERVKDDRRDFAYVVISWKDKTNDFHHFKERWIKDQEKWFTRVVGLVPNRVES